MLNKDQLEKMLYSLPSFYQDFLPVENNLSNLFNLYAHTIDYVWNVYKEANDSRFVSSARTLSTIPYFKVNIDNATYDLNTARVLARMTFEEQIAYLDKEQKYTSFSFHDKDNAGDPAVYSLKLYPKFDSDQMLELYGDYFLRSNRLYLLPRYIQERKQSVHYLHAFDIKLNDSTLEKNFGTRYSLQVGPLLPRHEYRDVLEAFARAFQGELTIRSLRDSIQLATKWNNFEIEDAKSPYISQRKLELYENFIISPNRFMVSLPEKLIPDKVKVNIVRSLLHEVKESNTNFMLFFDIDRKENMELPSIANVKTKFPRLETMSFEDTTAIPMVRIKVTDFPLEVFGRYDANFSYALNLQYDDLPGNETVSIKQGSKDTIQGVTPANFSISSTSNEVEGTTLVHQTISSSTVIHRNLRIPRNFEAERDTEGDIYFSHLSNDKETTDFELYYSDHLEGPYELLEVIANVTSSDLLYYQHNANIKGKRYYKCRSRNEHHASLYTLPIDINTI